MEKIAEKNMKWTGGKHNYYGKYNSSSKRKMSKIYRGLKVNFRELNKAFNVLDGEKKYEAHIVSS